MNKNSLDELQQIKQIHQNNTVKTKHIQVLDQEDNKKELIKNESPMGVNKAQKEENLEGLNDDFILPKSINHESSPDARESQNVTIREENNKAAVNFYKSK